jgi:hypothetical protein
MHPTGQRAQTNIIRARLPERSVHRDARTAVEAAMIKRSTWNVVHVQVADGHYRLAS